MNFLLTEWIQDWRGAEPQQLVPATLSLTDQRHLTFLAVSLGNGNFDEACFEVESIEVYEGIKGMLLGTGGCTLVGVSPAIKKCHLYRAGYEVFRQGGDAFFFINPAPRPELFSGSLAAYPNEFANANKSKWQHWWRRLTFRPSGRAKARAA